MVRQWVNTYEYMNIPEILGFKFKVIDVHWLIHVPKYQLGSPLLDDDMRYMRARILRWPRNRFLSTLTLPSVCFIHKKICLLATVCGFTFTRCSQPDISCQQTTCTMNTCDYIRSEDLRAVAYPHWVLFIRRNTITQSHIKLVYYVMYAIFLCLVAHSPRIRNILCWILRIHFSRPIYTIWRKLQNGSYTPIVCCSVPKTRNII